MDYSEHSIQSGNTEIVLSVWEAEQPDAAIIFIPATMVHPLFYEPLLAGFAERGFTVVGVHPVGHGKSPRVKRYTIRDIVWNARDAVSFALERYDLPVIVMGSSQGGIVASVLAAEDGRVTAAFPHCILLTELPDSVGVSRFPKWMRHVYRPTQWLFKFWARILPGFPVPLGFYLKYSRVSKNDKMWQSALADKLVLRQYPLYYLASLFTTTFPALTDGNATCPIYVIADSGDMLFTESYIQKVFGLLQAPHKEIITFDFNDHMFMFSYPQEVCEGLSGIMHSAVSKVGKA